MMICKAAEVNKPTAIDRQVQQVAEDALRATEKNLNPGADVIEQITRNIHTVNAARRPGRRPDHDAVLHVCLSAIILQEGLELYPYRSMLTPCPDPHQCHLAELVKAYLVGYVSTAQLPFALAMAAARVWIYPQRG